MKVTSRQLKAPRAYRMVARAEAAEATRVRIVEAARGQFAELPYDQVSLNVVARRAGVTVQTVLRRFGSKEALFAAVAAWRAASITAERDAAAAGDLIGAIRILVDSYERWGGEVLHFLAEEQRSPIIHEVTESGRRYHQTWVRRVFAPLLPEQPEQAGAQRLVQLIAVTDIFTWKLLRRDLGLGRDEVEASLADLVARILADCASTR
jgi:AcrR family transcriptional regulator